MEHTELDQALVASAFAQIAERGWAKLSIADAARAADLPLSAVRLRFPGKLALLQRFGQQADAMALEGAETDSPVRDRLFDLVMRRIDALQTHRAGMLALLRDLPWDPATVLALAPCHLASMKWLLDGCGVETTGLLGQLRVKGFLAVWLATVQAWRGDESEDLAATMAALDRALNRAEQAEASFGGIARSEK